MTKLFAYHHSALTQIYCGAPTHATQNSRRPATRAVRLSGPAERVAAIPCSAGSARQWRTLRDQLADFRLTALELRGHGRDSSLPQGGAASLAEEADAIAGACPGGPPFHLIGHSYGGAVALSFASRFSERVRSLTLIEPSCFGLLRWASERETGLIGEITALANAIGRCVAAGDSHGAMSRFIDYWSGPGSWAACSDSRKTRFARLATHVAQHFRSLLDENVPPAVYARVAAPTLILCGTNSPRPSRAIARILMDILPDARHRTIADAGHMSPLTHPTEVNTHILDHLVRNRARSGAWREAARLEAGGAY